MRRPLWTLVFALLLSCAPGDGETSVDLVLAGGTVIDVATGEALDNHDVWISGDRIVGVVPGDARKPPRGARIVSARDRFLVPGLVDAHTHLDHVDELELYIAHGVTTVFNLRGVPRHLAWREAVRNRERLGPTIYTAGDYMDGYPPYMEPMMSFDSPEDASAAVRAQAAAGYDMVKVYSRLSLDQLEAINRTAAEVGMPVVGHGSANYTLAELVGSGQLNLAHGQELLRWYADEDVDEQQLREIVETIRDSDLTVTPNLAWTDGLLRQGEALDELLADPIVASLPPAILQPFRRENNRYIRRGTDWVPDVKKRFELEKRLTRMLHQAGVTLLTGSDASTSGVLPGASLLIDVGLLVEAGLSPLDALRAATLSPGRFVAEHIDADVRFGNIAEGYRADILMIADNPMDDVSALGDPAGVVVAGRWLDRAELDARMEALAAKSRVTTTTVLEIERAVLSGDLEAARAAFDLARAADPTAVLFAQYQMFFIGYGYLYGDEGFNADASRRAAALELYKMYAETYPEYHSAHYLLALALEANGDRVEAIESLETALRIHPWYPAARAKLAAWSSDEEPGAG